MTYFATDYYTSTKSGSTISQVDTASPSLLPYPVHNNTSNIHSLAFTTDKEFVLNWGPANREIRRTKGFNTETPVYQHQQAIFKVRVRNVGGAERVYFSTPTASAIIEIYYLAGATPKLYTAIDGHKLTTPHPCDPNAEAYGWTGDFAFDSGNTLYLSSGNVGGGAKAGIYRIMGAGPDTVTGNVERIYLGDGPIEGLCYQSPQTLYFLHEREIWKLDLSTMKATLEGQIKIPNPPYPNWRPKDLTYLKDGFSVPAMWQIISLVWTLFHGAASATWGLGERLVVRATPPSQPPVG